EQSAAARALAVIPGGQAAERLRGLLAYPDTEVKRAALSAAARRPSATLVPSLLPLLLDPALRFEAREAVAAVGQTALPALERFLAGAEGPQAQAVAAHALARIGSRRAVEALLALARSPQASVRFVGL